MSDTQLIDNVWRPAEAYHFYILAQQQYKANNADVALRCALTLTEYEDVLPVQTIYNLIGAHRYESGAPEANDCLDVILSTLCRLVRRVQHGQQGLPQARGRRVGS